MVVQLHPVPLSSLYLSDEVAWLERSAALLREGAMDQLDTDHLAEYLSDMAISERREVKNRLTVLLMHLLKWEFQPEGRSGSWLSTILEQQRMFESLLESGTLFNHAEDVLAKAYQSAIKQAAAETGLARTSFPARCPWDLETMLIDPVVQE